jgi:hypothetical protein
LTTSGTAAVGGIYTNMQFSSLNVTALTAGGSGTHRFAHSRFVSDTANAISISSALSLNDCEIYSSNTNAITGAGSLEFGNLTFTGSSSTINTTTQTAIYTNLGKYRATRQPAFLAIQQSTATNATGDNTVYTLGTTVDLVEVFDQNSDFDPTTGTFTAPVTGRYSLTGRFFLTGGTDILTSEGRIVTSNETYRLRDSVGGGADRSEWCMVSTIFCDMDAGDTATFAVISSDGSGKVDDVYGDATDTWNSCCGYLVC